MPTAIITDILFFIPLKSRLPSAVVIYFLANCLKRSQPEKCTMNCFHQIYGLEVYIRYDIFKYSLCPRYLIGYPWLLNLDSRLRTAGMTVQAIHPQKFKMSRQNRNPNPDIDFAQH
jgi:hypothetical protein